MVENFKELLERVNYFLIDKGEKPATRKELQKCFYESVVEQIAIDIIETRNER